MNGIESKLESLKENYYISSEIESLLISALENLHSIEKEFFIKKAEGKIDTPLENQRDNALREVSDILLICPLKATTKKN